MKFLSGIIVLLFSVLVFQNTSPSIERMNHQSVNRQVAKIIPYIVNFNDTLRNDTLNIHVDVNNYPVKYSRKIITGVCADGVCRMVNIELFWNITGRFLGYRIPPGEFLSKTKHDKFTSAEYDRLQKVLSDPNSALASYTIDELAPKTDTTTIDTSLQKVDAVTSATIAELLNYIVKGAVYTTYTLWHIIYGQTKAEVEKYTTAHLSPELIIDLLHSENERDKIWALNHFSTKTVITDEIKNLLIEFISGNDVYLAERSLHALKPELITSDIQKQLATTFKNTGFLQKRLIIQKLNNVENLNETTIELLADELPQLNGILVKSTLQLYLQKNVNNKMVNEKVVELLKNDNRFIASQAFKYLSSLEIDNKKVRKKIEKYKRKNNS